MQPIYVLIHIDSTVLWWVDLMYLVFYVTWANNKGYDGIMVKNQVLTKTGYFRFRRLLIPLGSLFIHKQHRLQHKSLQQAQVTGQVRAPLRCAKRIKERKIHQAHWCEIEDLWLYFDVSLCGIFLANSMTTPWHLEGALKKISCMV